LYASPFHVFSLRRRRGDARRAATTATGHTGARHAKPRLDSNFAPWRLVGMSKALKSKRSGGARARNPARTRESLLQAAFEEIYKSGFRGSDVETILRKAGVTKGAMYHHFDNKEALGYSVVDEVIADIMREKWQSPLRDAENPVDALIGIVRSTSLKPEHLSSGCPLNNVSQEMSPLDEGFRKRTARVFNDWRGAIATALQEGKGRGFVRKDVDPDETATFLIAAYEGYMSLTKCFQDASGTRAGLKTLIGYLESLRPHGGVRATRRSPN
jgi:TetR/AcrR family transcriptional regulator, transcriptional repressor for nem operon